MAMDGAGNLYVADSLNHTIRKIVSSTGAVTTVALPLPCLAGLRGRVGGAIPHFFPTH